nr:hypothetical protein [Pseudonocardia alni]
MPVSQRADAEVTACRQLTMTRRLSDLVLRYSSRTTTSVAARLRHTMIAETMPPCVHSW